MRAAIYARYSSDNQRDASIEDQIRLCRDRLARDGAELVQTFSDRAISGATMLRPGLQGLLEEAMAGRFEVIYAEALDRLSRDQADVATIYKRLSFAGVQLVTVAEGAITELHVGLKGTMNALFLKDLAQKTRRGQRGRVEAGKVAGGNSYGYRVVHRMLADGSVTKGERQIDAAQAAIVVRIFEEYAAGLSPRRIATRLNHEDIAGPRGGAWNASTINGSRQRRNGILNNELYIGRLTWNRQRFLKDPVTGKRVSRPNPETEWITSEAPALRIIEDVLWERVQTLKGRYSSQKGNKRQTKKRLLSGLVKCGICGGSMTIARRDRYYCAARQERGTCTASHGILAADLECRVVNGLREILTGNGELLEVFTQEFKKEIKRLRQDSQRKQATQNAALAEVERGIARCLEFITSGDGAPAVVRERLRELEARKRDLESTRPNHRDTVVEIHPNFPELYNKKVSELSGLLEDERTRPQAMEAIRSLLERIDVFPGPKRGQCEVVLTGALAGILAFAHKKTTAPRDAEDGTFLLVAGAGFEPATFRL